MLTADDLAPKDAARRDAKRDLVEKTRELVQAVTLLDAEVCEPAEMDALAATVEEVTRAVRKAPTYGEGGLYNSTGFAGHLGERSPISGEANPLAAPLRVWIDGDTTRARATYRAAHEGPPGHVHGGVLLGAFDELLAVAQAASGLPGYTGTLSVRLRRPTPLFQPIDYEAGVDRVEGRKIHVWGKSLHRGEVTAEAEGIFIRRAETA